MPEAAPPSVVAQSPDQIAAALACGGEWQIFTAPWLAGAYGALCLAPDAAHAGRVVLDCGDDAGLAMGALRSGWKRIAFTGGATLRRRLADMAGKSGAALVDPPPAPEVILRPGEDAADRLRAWRAGNRDGGSET